MARLEPGQQNRSPEEEHNANTLDSLSKESNSSDTPKPDLAFQEKQREVALLERSLWRLERSVLPGLRRAIAEQDLGGLASLRKALSMFEEAVWRRHPLQDQDHEARSNVLDFGRFPKPGSEDQDLRRKQTVGRSPTRGDGAVLRYAEGNKERSLRC